VAKIKIPPFFQFNNANSADQSPANEIKTFLNNDDGKFLKAYKFYATVYQFADNFDIDPLRSIAIGTLEDFNRQTFYDVRVRFYCQGISSSTARRYRHQLDRFFKNFAIAAKLAFGTRRPQSHQLKNVSKAAHQHEGIRWPFVQFLLYNPYIITSDNKELATKLEADIPELMNDARFLIELESKP